MNPSTTGDIEMNLIGFNPNYPALHMTEALELIVSGDNHFNHDDVKSILNQATLLIEERSGSFTKYEFSKLNNLLKAALKMWLASRP